MGKLKVIQVMPEFGLAGAETMAENLVNALDKEKVDVSVVSLYDYHSPITDRLEKNGFKIYYLNKKKGIDLSMFPKLIKVFKEVKPDVIHTHRYVLEYVVLANLLSSKSRIVHTVHNIATKEVSKIKRVFQKFYFRKLRVVPVAISDIVKKTILEEYKLKDEQVPMIINAIDLSRCIPKNNYSKTHTILNIGRMEEQKNHKLLIDVFGEVCKKYPDYKLIIIGSGILKDEIEAQINEKELKDNVILAGAKDNCYEDLNKADIFVLSSSWEGMPMTIIEAMGTGTPIVASNVGGIPDMIQNEENGILVNCNKEEFVARINELIENDELREKIGKKALESSNVYSSKVMAEKYYKVYGGNNGRKG